jgi:serine/threonine protein kinase
MAQDPRARKRLALKLLEDVRDKVRRCGLKREYRLLKRFDHPGLPNVYRLAKHADGRLFTVMQLLPGQNLRILLRHRRDWVLKALPILIKTIASSLAYIHSKGVVHCDVKPENIVVGPGGRAYLVDFAGARWRRDWLRFWERIPKEASPSYITPEQILGKRPVPASDVYSFGVMVFEILAGRAPFTGTSLKALYSAHLKTPPPPLDRFLSGHHPLITRTVAQALEKKPRRRPRDVATWAYQIARLLDEEAQEGITVGARYGAAEG